MRQKVLTVVFIITVIVQTGCGESNSKEEYLIPSLIANQDFSNHLEISIAFWDVQNLENTTEKDAVWAYLEEVFNVTITPIHLNWSDYNERYMIMSVSNNLPDIISATTLSGASSNDKIQLSDLIERQLIRSLPNDLGAFPNVQSSIDANDSLLRQDDGLIYTFPRTTFKTKTHASSDAGMIVRKDWMKKLGYENPTSFEEFAAMVSAFANDDPDGNGCDDTIGYNSGSRLAMGKWLILGLAPECNVFSWVRTDEGYVPSYILPEFDQVVKAYRQLYDSGGLDPDFYIKKTTDAFFDFAKGDLGALEYKTAPVSFSELESYWNQYHNEDESFEDCVSYLNIFQSDDGNYYSNSSSPFWSESLFSAAVSEEKMARILYIYEYLLSDDGYDLTHLGLKNEDYTLVEDEYTCLLDTSEKSLNQLLLEKYPSLYLFSQLASWGSNSDREFQDTPMNRLRYGKTVMSLSTSSLEWNEENTICLDRSYEFISQRLSEQIKFTQAEAMDEFTQVIIGTEDPVEMWHEYIQSMYDNGLQTYIDRMNGKE